MVDWMNWKKLWLEFVKKEYDCIKVKQFEDKKLRLYAVDCGGYDTTNEVSLEEEETGIFLKFLDEKRQLIKKFKVNIGD